MSPWMWLLWGLGAAVVIALGVALIGAAINSVRRPTSAGQRVPRNPK